MEPHPNARSAMPGDVAQDPHASPARDAVDTVPGVPYRDYTSEEIYRQELERIFYRGHWCYVGLEAEIPEPGDFHVNMIGERSVIMVRDADRRIHVMENVCAHRGMRFCRERDGNRKEFVCPYHQWSYTLQGDLQGVPMRRGVRMGSEVKGGMPASFDLRDHGLTRLRVAARGGAVFASFDKDVEPFEDYLGPTILPYYDHLFSGRPLRVLGVQRQRLATNWKLILDNTKDTYHTGLLHAWFVTFGLARADNPARLLMDARHRHSTLVSKHGRGGTAEQVTEVASFHAGMRLNDPRFLDFQPEPWWNGNSVVISALFPNVTLQHNGNGLATRHIHPRGPGESDLVWTFFGFADDDAALTARRLRQANLVGPSGFVSADDGEALEFCQEGHHSRPSRRTVLEMDGHGIADAEHALTETALRGAYAYWQEVMGDD